MGNALSKKPLFVNKSGNTTLVPTKSKKIDLCSREIEKITENIQLFDKTVSLSLCCNLIKELPDEIGRLHILKKLHLENNELGTLPDSFETLSNLVVLNLGRNRLKVLPKAIYRLKKLAFLGLSYNPITELPPDIEQLQSLCTLEIKACQLRVLPIELTFIKTLQKIEAYGCPFYETIETTKCTETHVKQRYNMPITHIPTTCPRTKRTKVNSLRSTVARNASRYKTIRKTTSLATEYMQTVLCCSYCGGPYFLENCVYRLRFIKKDNQQFPFCYRLCSDHWNSEEERIRVSFEGHRRNHLALYSEEASSDSAAPSSQDVVR